MQCETEMIFEGPPVEAAPESVRRRPTPQSSFFKAVPEGLRSRSPLPPVRTPLQQAATWPASPVDPPAEMNEMEWTTSNVGRLEATRILHGIRVKRYLQPGGLHGPHSGTHGQTLRRRRQGWRQQWKFATHDYFRGLMLCISDGD